MAQPEESPERQPLLARRRVRDSQCLDSRYFKLGCLMVVLSAAVFYSGYKGPKMVHHQLQAGIRKAVVWFPDSTHAVDARYRGPDNAVDKKAILPTVSFYLYNITNLEEMRLGAKPKLEQVGPYIYKKVDKKVDVWWDNADHVIAKDYIYYVPVNTPQESNDRVVPSSSLSEDSAHVASWTQLPRALMRSLLFSSQTKSSQSMDILPSEAHEHSRSRGSSQGRSSSLWQMIRGGGQKEEEVFADASGGGAEGARGRNATEDRIVTLNLPLLGVVETIHGRFGNASALLLDLVVAILSGWREEHVDGLFVNRSAHELMWGYEDLLLQRLAGLLPEGTIPSTSVQLVPNMTSIQEAQAQQPTVYNTGHDHLSKVWEVVSDQGHSQITSWPGGSDCAERVQGTDGSQFTPGVKCTGQVLKVWASSLFRSLDFVCIGSHKLHGVKLHRFWPDPAQMEVNPCRSQSLIGLMNISGPAAVGATGDASSAHGPPLFLSTPHFCMCDKSLRAGVEGLEGCHDVEGRLATLVDVEPYTGMTMRGVKRMMISSQITPSARLHIETKINSSVVLPILWFEESVQIGKSQAQNLKDSVYWAIRMERNLQIWPMLIGGALTAMAVVLFVAGVETTAAAARAQFSLNQSTQTYYESPGIQTGGASASEAKVSEVTPSVRKEKPIEPALMTHEIETGGEGGV